MKNKRRKPILSSLKDELFFFDYDREGLLYSSEHWSRKVKKKIVRQACYDGFIIIEKDVNIIWNNTVMEYIVYVQGVFFGYLEFFEFPTC